MKKAMEKYDLVRDQIDALSQCDWYSRLNQERYWTGSPWRAFSELFK